eukprot:scaffold42448_cov30-Tisochrysis_lutea.AAC.2
MPLLHYHSFGKDRCCRLPWRGQYAAGTGMRCQADDPIIESRAPGARDSVPLDAIARHKTGCLTSASRLATAVAASSCFPTPPSQHRRQTPG